MAESLKSIMIAFAFRLSIFADVFIAAFNDYKYWIFDTFATMSIICSSNACFSLSRVVTLFTIYFTLKFVLKTKGERIRRFIKVKRYNGNGRGKKPMNRIHKLNLSLISITNIKKSLIQSSELMILWTLQTDYKTMSTIGCPSIISHSFCRASSRNTGPTSRRICPYWVFFRHLLMNTTWYLHSHVVCFNVS